MDIMHAFMALCMILCISNADVDIYIYITISIHSPSLTILDSKVDGANMGPIWGRQNPGGPHVGPINLAIWDNIDIVIPNVLVFVPEVMSHLINVHWHSQLAYFWDIMVIINLFLEKILPFCAKNGK